jgi:hypothetical protein
MPPPQKKSAKKSLLAQLGPKARHEIVTIMDERDGKLSLHEYLTKYWDWFAPWRGPFTDDREIAQRQDANRAEVARLHPDWSPEQVDVAIRLWQIPMHLKDAAIARRFALDDPGELARGLAILNRFDQITASDPARERVLDICASGDVEHARRLVEGRCHGHTAIMSLDSLHMDVIYSILQRNPGFVSRLVPQFALQRGVGPWLEGIYIALRGASENRPDEVARGLQVHMTGLHKMHQKPELDGAINLCVHGLYRLLQWVSAGLVSQFDAGQRFPWDAAFHAWVDAHPNPLADLQLADISPVLHDLIVHGKTPSWLVPPAEPLYEIVLLGGDPKSNKLLNEIEGCAGGNGSLKSAKALLAHAPWPLRWDFRKEDKDYLDACRRSIEQFGGRAEVREMAPNRFRFFIPAEVG